MAFSANALATVQRGFAQAPAFTEQQLLVATTEATMLLEREVKEAMPRGATGLSAGSITSDVMSTPAGVLGVTGSTQPSVLFLELGTRPHMPPVEALIPWVRAVMGKRPEEARSIAFLIARKIKQRGTKPRRIFENTLKAQERQVERFFEAAADRIAAHLAGGAA
ncbi:hypothetical protein [Ramlibacter sp.]|uniref:hypothetical protein n=1 Tax=Ramlibacter sp. TaxID=1917967 RepID=UPI003D1432F1